MNLVQSDSDDDQIDVTHLDVSDFFADPEGRIDHLIWRCKYVGMKSLTNYVFIRKFFFVF